MPLPGERADLRKALETHIEAERSRDIEAIVASLSDDPYYIVPGFELRGRAALRAMYQRAMPALTPENSDETLRALDDPAVTTWGPDHIILEYTRDYPIHYGMVVIVRFADGRVRSEHTFYSSAEGPPALAGSLEGTPGATPVRRMTG
ncbi:MAG: nuclear transport factor 2 family protein [Sphingomonadaceae bacterium]|nr:nuclear transport factor 2 family protein [Sphingomonadaceae bacterium]